MKRKLLIVSASAVCIAVGTVGTLAYFTSETRARNVITTGSVDVQLVEQTVNDGKLTDFPKAGISGVMPGQSVSKIVKVKNTGTAEAWVRLSAEISVMSADGKPLNNKYVTIKPNDSWKQSGVNGDEHWYYVKALNKGDLTDEFIGSVDFSPEMSSEYRNCTVNVDISAQAVQTTNNGSDVFKAAGW